VAVTKDMISIKNDEELKFRSSQDVQIKTASPKIDGEELAQRMNYAGVTPDDIFVSIYHLGALF
jgi:hypothetical protein